MMDFGFDGVDGQDGTSGLNGSVSFNTQFLFLVMAPQALMARMAMAVRWRWRRVFRRNNVGNTWNP